MAVEGRAEGLAPYVVWRMAHSGEGKKVPFIFIRIMAPLTLSPRLPPPPFQTRDREGRIEDLEATVRRLKARGGGESGGWRGPGGNREAAEDKCCLGWGEEGGGQ